MKVLGAIVILMIAFTALIAGGAALLMGFCHFVNAAGFDIPAISFRQAGPIFVLGAALLEVSKVFGVRVRRG